MTTADPTARAALIRDLRELTDWLDANPDVPVSQWGTVEVTFHPAHDDDTKTDEAAFAAVRRIADLIGATVDEDPERAKTTRSFGSAVYKAVAHTANHMARYNAGTSYLYVVEPETAGAR